MNQALERQLPQSREDARESAVYLHDEEEIEFFLWEVLDIQKRLMGRAPFDKLTREGVDELLQRAKLHAFKLAEAYSDTDGDHARLLDNGDVVIPQKYHALWQEHLRDWFWLRNQGESFALQENKRMYLPIVVMQLIMEMFTGANASFMTYAGFAPSAMKLIEARGTPKQKALFLEKLSSTEWDACLCITEPQAGSDLSAIVATASRIGNEEYAVTGEKRYITAGMHPLTRNTVYVVLGRVEGAKPSSLSMSTFLVPRYWPQADGSLCDNNVRCIRVEKKMGLNGCANTHLQFGRDGITRGYLLGDRPNVGLLQLQLMMRKARVGTGQIALSLASSAYLRSLRYARQRIQGAAFDQSSNPAAPRVPILEHLDVQRMLLEMKTKVEGCRALLARMSMHATRMQQMLHEKLSREDPEFKRHTSLASLYSPIAKAYISDEAWSIATAAIQVHGAIGYTRDLPLEQYARDIKILTIWEGTNYIQAQDLIRDKLGFGRQSLVLQHLAQDMRAFLQAAPQMSDLVPEYQRAGAALDAVLKTMVWVKERADRGELLLMSQFCTRILQMFGDLLVCWGLLEAATVAESRLREAASDQRRAFYVGKIKSMRFFVYNSLPRLFGNAAIIEDSVNAYARLGVEEFGYPQGGGFV